MRVELFKINKSTYERWHYQILWSGPKLMGRERVVAVSPRSGYLSEADCRADVELMRKELQGATVVSLERGDGK